ncbi:SseB family protein [Saccharopolyspora hordei]|uniref:SseB protein N-terminal domain-containing protein n=1 Tax=Saccharopolyspora hordei TaxID=1838 RepID=A0A853AF23_9PSEU|nr:SseB family protein [Saccharopolyspora hordei]NYI83144.1 hypothetical protein [Saccharopolyspora hordei]
MPLEHPRPGTGFPRSAVRLSGDLFAPRGPALLDVLHRFRAGQASLEHLAAALRDTTLFTAVSDEDGGTALITARSGETSWLAVFTSPARMAEFHRRSGRGADAVRYAEVTGADLLDQCLPALPRGTGLVVDAGSGHRTALAPVPGLVPDQIALEGNGS